LTIDATAAEDTLGLLTRVTADYRAA